MHPLDFGGLVVGDVGRELEQHRIVSRARLFEQFLDHGHRAFVVRDHQLKEQPVEIGSRGGGEVGHLLRCRHAGHALVGVHGGVVRRVRRRLAAVLKPGFHELDLVPLGELDAPGRVGQFRPVGAIGHQFRHLHGLLMVGNHVPHEPDVVRRVARNGNPNRLFGSEFLRRLAGRPRLHDG